MTLPMLIIFPLVAISAHLYSHVNFTHWLIDIIRSKASYLRQQAMHRENNLKSWQKRVISHMKYSVLFELFFRSMVRHTNINGRSFHMEFSFSLSNSFSEISYSNASQAAVSSIRRKGSLFGFFRGWIYFINYFTYALAFLSALILINAGLDLSLADILIVNPIFFEVFDTNFCFGNPRRSSLYSLVV